MSTDRDPRRPPPDGDTPPASVRAIRSKGAAREAAPPSIWPGILVGAALGAVVGAASLLVPTGPSAPPRPAPAPPALSAVPSAMPSASGSAAPASASGAPSAEPVAESEADYIHRAEVAPPAEALALVEAHGKRYPEGKLNQDREVIAVRALAALGRKDEARARARLFLTLFPGSPLRSKLEAAVPDLAPAASGSASAPAP